MTQSEPDRPAGRGGEDDASDQPNRPKTRPEAWVLLWLITQFVCWDWGPVKAVFGGSRAAMRLSNGASGYAGWLMLTVVLGAVSLWLTASASRRRDGSDSRRGVGLILGSLTVLLQWWTYTQLQQAIKASPMGRTAVGAEAYGSVLALAGAGLIVTLVACLIIPLVLVCRRLPD
jgi:hypothetical protein